MGRRSILLSPPRTAAAATASVAQRERWQARADWQLEIPRLLQECSLLRFPVWLKATTAANARVTVERMNNAGQWERTEEAVPLACIRAITPALLERACWQAESVGEFYVEHVDGPPGHPPVPVLHSVAAMERSGSSFRIRDSARATPRAVPAERLQRAWIEDKDYPLDATSNVRGSLNDIEDYLTTLATIRATNQSRLVGNGLIWFASDLNTADIADRYTNGTGRPPSMPTVAAAYLEYAGAAYKVGRDRRLPVTATAPFPTWGEKPPEYVEIGRKHDPMALEDLEAAAKRFARGYPFPSSVLLEGPGGEGNHWSAYLTRDEGNNSHIRPLLSTVLNDLLTRASLRPLLAAYQLHGWSGDPERYRIGFDMTAITAPSDLSQFWQWGVEANVIKAEAAVRHLIPGITDDEMLEVGTAEWVGQLKAAAVARGLRIPDGLLGASVEEPQQPRTVGPASNPPARLSVAATAPSDLSKRAAMICLRMPRAGDWTVELPQDAHITLAFLGDDVSDKTFAAVERAVARVAETTGPIPLRFTHQSLLGRDGTALVWEATSPELHELRRRIVWELNRDGIAWSDQYAFRPHMTLRYLEPGQEEYTGPIDPTDVLVGSGICVAGAWQTPDEWRCWPFGLAPHGYTVHAAATPDRRLSVLARRLNVEQVRVVAAIDAKVGEVVAAILHKLGARVATAASRDPLRSRARKLHNPLTAAALLGDGELVENAAESLRVAAADTQSRDFLALAQSVRTELGAALAAREEALLEYSSTPSAYPNNDAPIDAAAALVLGRVQAYVASRIGSDEVATAGPDFAELSAQHSANALAGLGAAAVALAAGQPRDSSGAPVARTGDVPPLVQLGDSPAVLAALNGNAEPVYIWIHRGHVQSPAVDYPPHKALHHTAHVGPAAETLRDPDAVFGEFHKPGDHRGCRCEWQIEYRAV